MINTRCPGTGLSEFQAAGAERRRSRSVGECPVVTHRRTFKKARTAMTRKKEPGHLNAFPPATDAIPERVDPGAGGAVSRGPLWAVRAPPYAPTTDFKIYRFID